MTRITLDSPSAYDSSELRDLSTTPTSVRSANITIIHPQLRDLLLPLDRGRVLYPHGTVIEEQQWRTNYDDDNPGDSPSHIQNLYKLAFVPTCLTSNGSILACGGQKGELFLCDLPQPTGGKLKATAATEAIKPFTVNLTLPSRSINNAITILPSWPRGWVQRREEWQRAYAGYARGRPEDLESDTESDEGEDDEEACEDDEFMDYLEEDDEEVQSPASSVATYPNTIPFGVPRRMSRPGHNEWAQRPQYVTSSAHGGRHSPASTSSSRRSRMRPDEPRILISNNDKTVKMFSLRRILAADREQDLDDRMPLRVMERDLERERDRQRTRAGSSQSPAQAEGWEAWAPAMSALRRTVDGADARYRALEASLGSGSRDLPPLPTLPPRRQLFGSSLGYDGIGLNEGILAQDLRQPPTPPPPAPRPPITMRSSEDVSLRGTRYLGESLSEYRARNPTNTVHEPDDRRMWQILRQERAAELERRIGLVSNPDNEACKLYSIGGQRFKLAVNHSSLSPDLRTMVTVGDSTDVYLHEVLDGGTSFRRIGVYNAATDSGFSTSWSKDGRRFAVASQDGQVTVWDHRSSRPLAIFHTQPQTPGHTRYHEFDERATMEPPVGSQSGLEAARVVKFSPEGSSRDLLVFSEELTRIHIVDARTFQSHIYLDVPFDTGSASPGLGPSRRPRRGVDGGLYGISGIAFDPTGDWLYAGTERTVVEWDMRRYGGGEGGTWSMA